MTRVIFNADDFGASASINAAVLRAHREGVLTSASLMVTGDAAAEAIEIARANPGLAVGLHVVLVRGRSALPASELPHLVDSAGRFRDDAARAGAYYFFSRAARRELARELEAQLQLFARTGLPLAHVDGHLNLHVHPAVLPLLVPLAQRYGARGFRLPNDDIWLALKHDSSHALSKCATFAALRALSLWAAPKLGRAGLTQAERVFGLIQSGHMDRGYVLTLLEDLHGASAELYLHPTDGPRQDEQGPNPEDLATLLDPAVRGLVEGRGMRLATYPSLAEGR